MPTIDGYTGPYPNYHQGYIGRNAAHKAGKLAETSPEALMNTDIRYARLRDAKNPDKLALIQNAFGYAAVDMDQFDRTGDKALDKTELTAAFGGEGVAQLYLDAYDVADKDGHKDGKIDLVESAGSVLLTDNASKLLAGTLHAFGQQPNSRIFAGEQQADLNGIADRLVKHWPSKLDGKLSAAERTTMDEMILQMPTFVRKFEGAPDIRINFVNQTLAAIIDGLDLRNRVNAFRV